MPERRVLSALVAVHSVRAVELRAVRGGVRRRRGRRGDGGMYGPARRVYRFRPHVVYHEERVEPAAGIALVGPGALGFSSRRPVGREGGDQELARGRHQDVHATVRGERGW